MRLVQRDRVRCYPVNATGPQYAISTAALKVLEAATDARGRPIEVTKILLPPLLHITQVGLFAHVIYETAVFCSFVAGGLICALEDVKSTVISRRLFSIKNMYVPRVSAGGRRHRVPRRRHEARSRGEVGCLVCKFFDLQWRHHCACIRGGCSGQQARAFLLLLTFLHTMVRPKCVFLSWHSPGSWAIRVPWASAGRLECCRKRFRGERW